MNEARARWGAGFLVLAAAARALGVQDCRDVHVYRDSPPVSPAQRVDILPPNETVYAVSMAAQGPHVVYAWWTNGNNMAMRVSHDSGETLGPPVPIPRSASGSATFAVSLDPDLNLYLISSILPPVIRRSSDFGVTWSAPVSLPASISQAIWARATGQGRICAVGWGGSVPFVRVTTSDDGGSTWGPTVTVGSRSWDRAALLRLDAAASGEIRTLTRTDASRDLNFAYSGDFGDSWSESYILAESQPDPNDVRMAAADPGATYAAFVRHRALAAPFVRLIRYRGAVPQATLQDSFSVQDTVTLGGIAADETGFVALPRRVNGVDSIRASTDFGATFAEQPGPQLDWSLTTHWYSDGWLAFIGPEHAQFTHDRCATFGGALDLAGQYVHRVFYVEYGDCDVTHLLWINSVLGPAGVWTQSFGRPGICREDIDADGSIGLSDLAELLVRFGCSGECGPADIDRDGAVALPDLARLLRLFGGACL